MKIRRSLALAAATAAIAPAVLLAAPAAYATDNGPSSSESQTTPAPAESTPAADDTTPAAEEAEPAEESTTPAAEEAEPAEESTSPAAEEKTASDEEKAPSDDSTPEAGSTSPSPSPSETSPAGPAECSDEDMRFDGDLRTSLSGLPSKIVAGSGFHGFTLNVDNKADHGYERIDFGVFAALIDENDFFVDTGNLTLQYKDPATGAWTGISLDEEDEHAGYLGYTDIKAHESFSVDLRLSVDKKAPAGLGFAISIGMYADDEGNCVYADDESYYEFDILAAGSTPVDTGDAKPQGGSKPLPQKPTGNTPIDPEGRLAETGSSSALPVIALAGGAAVAVGVGATFLVRRRSSAPGTV
ncbi:LAETG motif-containing sortase-dependent surface protein [Streptomyces sp. NPDC047999]|uniref:LAETG motif-containing sortase-dependent surface protein n=1 Tax=unclassified Streptomyces TaxID=2593676 RepID=UPI0037241873